MGADPISLHFSHRKENSVGVKKLKKDARVGGDVAGNARKETEKKINRKIISNKNYLQKLTNKKFLDK